MPIYSFDIFSRKSLQNPAFTTVNIRLSPIFRLFDFYFKEVAKKCFKAEEEAIKDGKRCHENI